MEAYPTVLTMPNRKQRKSARRRVFEANRLAGNARRRARKEARKAAR